MCTVADRPMVHVPTETDALSPSCAKQPSPPEYPVSVVGARPGVVDVAGLWLTRRPRRGRLEYRFDCVAGMVPVFDVASHGSTVEEGD